MVLGVVWPAQLVKAFSTKRTMDVDGLKPKDILPELDKAEDVRQRIEAVRTMPPPPPQVVHTNPNWVAMNPLQQMAQQQAAQQQMQQYQQQFLGVGMPAQGLQTVSNWYVRASTIRSFGSY